MKREYFFYIIIIAGLLVYLYYLLGQIRVTVDFDDLEPFKRSLPVFYKGFKLGHTTRVYPSPDFKSTRVDLKLRLKELRLPENTGAMVRRKDKKDYIELIYPARPYIAHLRNNSVIEGTKGVNFESYIQDQAKNGGLDAIRDNVNGTITAAGETFKALTEMINVMTGIMEDARPQITDTVQNLNFASRNVADASLNVSSTLRQGYVDNTLENLELTTRNLVLTTENITGVTGKVNKSTIGLIDCLICNINTVVGNVNEIILTVGDTLKTRFGGLRLFLGKPSKGGG